MHGSMNINILDRHFQDREEIAGSHILFEETE
jgi:hypothetical protein